MLHTITTRTDLTLDGETYEIDARAEVFVSNVINHWEIDTVEIECDERVILWRDLPKDERDRILDLLGERIGGTELVGV